MCFYCYVYTMTSRPDLIKSILRNSTDYTDRLDQGNSAKYAGLAKKHYSSGTSNYERPFDEYNCKGHLIEAFLRDWYADPALKLLRVVEYCNPCTGYQTWRLDYHRSNKTKGAS